MSASWVGIGRLDLLRAVVVLALAGILLILPGSSVAAAMATQATGPISRSEEIILARSAGPPALAAAASIYVLGEAGYELAHEGTNGASCLVSRDRVDTSEPLCFDAQGTRSVLPIYLERGRLRAAGATDDEIDERIGAGFRTGEFGPPEQAGVAYMLSPQNRVFNGSEVVSYPPHIMVYAPYVTNEDIGAELTDPFMPWVLEEGTPLAYIVVVVGGR